MAPNPCTVTVAKGHTQACLLVPSPGASVAVATKVFIPHQGLWYEYLEPDVRGDHQIVVLSEDMLHPHACRVLLFVCVEDHTIVQSLR